jgi:hypothetical protein
LVAVPIALTLAAVGSFRHATAGQDTAKIEISFTPDPPVAGSGLATTFIVTVCSDTEDVTKGAVALLIDDHAIPFPNDHWTRVVPTSTESGCAEWTFIKTTGLDRVGFHEVSATFTPDQAVLGRTGADDVDFAGPQGFEVLAAPPVAD